MERMEREKPDLSSVLLTTGQAAQILNVHTNTLRRWAGQGAINAFRLGPRRDRRFVRSEVEHLLKAQH